MIQDAVQSEARVNIGSAGAPALPKKMVRMGCWWMLVGWMMLEGGEETMELEPMKVRAAGHCGK